MGAITLYYYYILLQSKKKEKEKDREIKLLYLFILYLSRKTFSYDYFFKILKLCIWTLLQYKYITQHIISAISVCLSAIWVFTFKLQ